MSKTRTLAQLRERARLLADERPDGTDQFISDSELTGLINARLAGLYDLLVEARGHEHYRSTTDISTVAGTETYSLPADFYQVLDVTLQWDTDHYTDLLDYHLRDAPRYRGAQWVQYSRPYYRVSGTSISILPVPTEVKTITVGYVPTFTDLAADSDTFDGINGWEILAVTGAAIDMLAIQEQANTQLERRYQEALERIQTGAANRAAMAAPRVWDEGDTESYTYQTIDGGGFVY